MADAQLADIDLARGLYCSIFPVFMYVVFGPSRHISVGKYFNIRNPLAN